MNNEDNNKIAEIIAIPASVIPDKKLKLSRPFLKIQANAVFYAAIFAEIILIVIHYFNTLENPPVWLKMGYLWYNLVGCSLVVIIGFLLQSLIRQKKIN